MEHFTFKKILSTLFLSITYLKLSVSVHTLLPNQTITINQTMVCKSQVFELAFFSPGNSTNTFLGVRYKSTPDVVVWVANRNNPITDPRRIAFSVSRNGTLVISSGGIIVWYSSPSMEASNPSLQLLDTGNLVLLDEEREREGYLWQSFDYPANNWLQGLALVDDDVDAGVEKYLTSWKNRDDPSPGDFALRIENRGLPEMVIYRGEVKIYRTGKWNGKQFSCFPPFPNPIFKADLVFRENRLISATRPYDSSVFTRTELHESGSIRRYTLNARKDEWNHVYTFPQDRCDEYGYCGPFGICRIGYAQRCECLKGFAPKFQEDWDLQDWRGGCGRTKPLDCGGGDDFLEVKGVKHPDMLEFRLNSSMSLAECRDECLKNCGCTAFANPYITDNGGSGCVLWLGDLIDIRELPGEDSNRSLYVRLPISELGVTNALEKKRRRMSTKLIVLVIASGVLLVWFIVGLMLLMRRRTRRASKVVDYEDLELPLFKFATIMAATKDFSRENFIGEGGFGPVYKGNLSAEEEIAIKRLSRASQQGLDEFKTEVTLIAKLQHRNLVRLLDAALKEKKECSSTNTCTTKASITLYSIIIIGHF